MVRFRIGEKLYPITTVEIEDDIYHIEEVLGQGCFGTTLSGNSVKSGKVAIKILQNSENAGHEIYMLDKLRSSQHIVKIFTHGDVVTDDILGFRKYLLGKGIVLELLGQSLQKWRSTEYVLPLQDIVAIIQSIALGVQEIHKIGIIHDDIKPDNILQSSSSGRDFKLADVGIAKKIGITTKFSSEADVHSYSHSYSYSPDDKINSIKARSQYAPPENFSTMPLTTFGGDIYSIGCIMYFLSVGDHPYTSRGITTIEQMARAKYQNPLSLSSFEHSQLKSIIEKATNPIPFLRYSNVESFLSDLKECSAVRIEIRMPSPPRILTSPPPSPPLPPRPSPRSPSPKQPQSLAGFIIAIVIGVAVVIGTILSIIAFSKRPDDMSDFVEQVSRTYSCGEANYTVKEYLHQPTALVFIQIPAGSFEMGGREYDNELPRHNVSVKSFLMSNTEVTQGIWEKVMGTTPWKGQRNVMEGENYPAVYISLEEAKAFCEKIRLSLPTEAQWEYACRAGTKTEYYWGADMNGDYAWFRGNVMNQCACEVKGKKPNAFGLYDMSGNVWEWCEDNWHNDYSNAPCDGRAWKGNSNNYVNRGGSYEDSTCTSTKRVGSWCGSKRQNLGFRVVKNF